MMREVAIRNYKSLREVRVRLDRLTVLVGPNASGKSSILQGLHFLCQVFQSQGNSAENKVFEGLSRGAEGCVELAAETEHQCFRYRSRSHTTGASREEASELDSTDWVPLKKKGTNSNPLPLSVLLGLEASNLISPNPGRPDPTVMAPNGLGVHSALASMALNDPDTWRTLQKNLHRIIPSIRRLRHTRESPPALLFDTLGGDSLPASQVSEGTLLVVGLLTALHAQDRPNLMLLDDLDRGLHPRAQKEVVMLLRGLLETNSDLQIVAATHSPYLLDWLEPNEVRMTCLREGGSTACGSIQEHPDFERWKDEMAPGEMWSLFGENWLAEKGAAS